MGSSDAFVPHMSQCDVHGEYQQNVLESNQEVRWLPTCPKCTREAAMATILGRAAVPLRFQRKSFDDYTVNVPGQRGALAIAKAYAQGFEEQLTIGRCLVFCGLPGTGKTHLAAAILNTIVAGGRGGLYATVYSAVSRVKETWSKGGGERERDAIAKLVLPDLLVLDEVGVQFNSEAEKIILFEIINGRYEKVRPMILVSNLDIKGVEDSIGYRAVDRLREGGGRVVVFDWESHRRAA